MNFKKLSLLLLLLIFPAIAESKNKIELMVPDSSVPDSGWGSSTDTIKNLEILDFIDESSSRKKFNEALEDYKTAVGIFQNAEDFVEKKKEEFTMEVHPEDRYDWQKNAREDAQNKDLVKISNEGRNQSLQYLVRSMTSLDKIENPKIKESQAYLELKAGLYREYAKHQFAFRNYGVVADILTRYIALDAKFKTESEPHRLLAHCFEKMEIGAAKNKKTFIAEEYKEKKKSHILSYAEVQYGKDSKEYESIAEKVMKDY
ncbi:MAG: hypothetical protein GW938_09245 [Leptospira sp.]|nr:hypothetical protein [Leptospira sp.]NCS95481.1 hypothetical protein [Leptospira sp.]